MTLDTAVRLALRNPPDTLPHVHDDGGRSAAGFTGTTGDCAVRSVAIATGLPYRTVYDDLLDAARSERASSRKRGRSHPRTGVHTATFRRYLERTLLWTWTPTMHIGQGCRVHVRTGRGGLPPAALQGPAILNLSRHFCAVVDGVIRDTHDPARNGTRCVYGYWLPPCHSTVVHSPSNR